MHHQHNNAVNFPRIAPTPAGELSEEQKNIAFNAATERPFGKYYDEFKKQGGGVYHCVVCGEALFVSDHKFDARCGWPAFYQQVRPGATKHIEDNSHGMKRVEVRCGSCDAHLGHIFSGEGFDTPLDQRYCINGAVLKFVPFSERPAPAPSEQTPSNP